MGAIGGEELTKWEEMQGVASGGSEQKILVLVRLRPLSEKEIARNEVSDWECINETTILFRNSLQEQSMFPTAHTFDGVFSGDCSTRQVYEQGTKEIALSVGRAHEDRAFVLKFSAMEIYNEAVRDLLSTDSLPLRVVDDLEASARTDIKVQPGAWSWDIVSGEEFRVGTGLAEPYPITWPRACCHPWP